MNIITNINIQLIMNFQVQQPILKINILRRNANFFANVVKFLCQRGDSFSEGNLQNILRYPNERIFSKIVSIGVINCLKSSETIKLC